MRPSRFTWRRWVMTIAAVSLSWSGLSGCTAGARHPRDQLEPCFHALAIAADAVHDHGVFAGVRLVSASSLAKIHRVEAVAKARSTTPLHNVCLVAYRGDFRLTDVARPAGLKPPSGLGHFAVVVVSTPQNKLLATFVLQKEPVRFRHLALGELHTPAPGEGPSVVG